jgi:hypothetical protein
MGRSTVGIGVNVGDESAPTSRLQAKALNSNIKLTVSNAPNGRKLEDRRIIVNSWLST